jgi:hypothetical protein
MIKPVISLDFDGVIHSYTSPWTCCEEINDPPVEGALDFIRNAIQSGFHVNIHTARANDPVAEPSIIAWLLKHGLEHWFIDQMSISAIKRSALVYIDDRGLRFEGKFPSFDEIRALKQWNKK